MTVKRRDQRQYNLVQQYTPDPIPNTVLGIITDIGDPCAVKTGLGSMAPQYDCCTTCWNPNAS